VKRGQLTWRTPLRAVSPRRARQLRRYSGLRAQFLESRPWCQFPGCEQRAVVVHHRRGRSGDRLTDVEWWAASCVEHNDFAETRTGEALTSGWLTRVEAVS
jgi:hypothetical protein